MSKSKMIIQMLNGIEKMLKGIEKTLTQQTLIHKDVLNSSEAALYMGRSVSGIYRLRSQHKLPSYRPHNGRLYFYKVELFDWMRSDSPGNRKELKAPEEAPAAVETMASTEEEEVSAEDEEEAKMAIFNQEGG